VTPNSWTFKGVLFLAAFEAKGIESKASHSRGFVLAHYKKPSRAALRLKDSGFFVNAKCFGKRRKFLIVKLHIPLITTEELYSPVIFLVICTNIIFSCVNRVAAIA
jgi:hypothetical protein